MDANRILTGACVVNIGSTSHAFFMYHICQQLVLLKSHLRAGTSHHNQLHLTREGK